MRRLSKEKRHEEVVKLRTSLEKSIKSIKNEISKQRERISSNRKQRTLETDSMFRISQFNRALTRKNTKSGKNSSREGSKENYIPSSRSSKKIQLKMSLDKKDVSFSQIYIPEPPSPSQRDSSRVRPYRRLKTLDLNIAGKTKNRDGHRHPQKPPRTPRQQRDGGKRGSGGSAGRPKDLGVLKYSDLPLILKKRFATFLVKNDVEFERAGYRGYMQARIWLSSSGPGRRSLGVLIKDIDFQRLTRKVFCSILLLMVFFVFSAIFELF